MPRKKTESPKTTAPKATKKRVSKTDALEKKVSEQSTLLQEVASAVKQLTPSKGVKVGKPKHRIVAAYGSRMKTASYGGDTVVGSGGNIYSPELSPDMLELPQTLDEQRSFYRHFYENDPFVGQAIDLNTEIPLSKLKYDKPEAKDQELAEKAYRDCKRWADDIGLQQKLIGFIKEFNLFGEANVFAEDTSPDMPKEITHERAQEMDGDGQLEDVWVERADANERHLAWVQKHYKGWTALRLVPPEQIQIQAFPFTDRRLVDLIPDAQSKQIIELAAQGDERAQEIVASMPPEIVDAILTGGQIPLNTDPDAGSFLYTMARKSSEYETRGKSILQRCMRTLVLRDKIRHAVTSTASRHMTPIRLVYAETLSDGDLDDLRDQIDLALQDPDHSIITNFQVNWEELGAEQRIPDFSAQLEHTDRQLYAGLGVTESLLSGESSYSGDKINLEVVNIRHSLLREALRLFVEKFLFKPMCRRWGYIEQDEDGNEVVIYPKLGFTRIGLRDNQETFDILYNLYSKGSLDIDTIYELLNLDPKTVNERLEKDKFTLKDATFNELLRGIYGTLGTSLAETTNIGEVIAENLGLTKQAAPAEEEGMGRFASRRHNFNPLIIGGLVDAVVSRLKDAAKELIADLKGTPKKKEA
jgi:hypothetical protein